jgi:hypothetical protein
VHFAALAGKEKIVQLLVGKDRANADLRNAVRYKVRMNTSSPRHETHAIWSACLGNNQMMNMRLTNRDLKTTQNYLLFCH